MLKSTPSKLTTRTRASRTKHPIARAVAGVAGALLLASGTVSAQTAANQDGNALDANPRVGSGGSNTAGVAPSPYGGSGYDFGAYGSYGNNVVTGNVTGGRAFRGDVGYTDPRSFRGETAGQGFDAFSRSASGATTGGQLIDYANTVVPYYGDNTVAAPPPGFQRTPGTGGYVPARLGGFSGDLRSFDTVSELGPGYTDVLNREFDSPLMRFFEGGATEADLRVSNTASPTNITRLSTSERLVLGGRLTGGDEARSLADATARELSPYTQLGRDDRLTGLTGERIRALGGELLRDEEGNRVGADAFDELLNEQVGERDGTRRAAGQAAQGQQGGELSNLERIERGARPAGQLGAAEDPVLRLADPAEQSAQYAQLQRRLDRFRADPLAEELRPRGLSQERHAQQEQATELPGLDEVLPNLGSNPLMPGINPQQLDPRQSGPSDAPPRGGIPEDMPDLPDTPEAQAPLDPPVTISSFAAGVTSPTLRDLIEEAETLMAEGKYVSAVTRFNAAEYLVPNQPIVSLGQATAELGAGYYRRAADDLRAAFNRNPELLMARVDLEAMLGQERVTKIAEDLRQLADRDRQADDPLFLLAFLSYGSSRYSQAATFLDLAQERSQDPVYETIKRMWALDDRAAQEQGNAAPADDNAPAEPAPTPESGASDDMTFEK